MYQKTRNFVFKMMNCAGRKLELFWYGAELWFGLPARAPGGGAVLHVQVVST